jgi:hypothetical protein
MSDLTAIQQQLSKFALILEKVVEGQERAERMLFKRLTQKELITKDEAMSYMGVKKTKFYDLVAQGKIHPNKPTGVGKKGVLYSMESIKKWVSNPS